MTDPKTLAIQLAARLAEAQLPVDGEMTPQERGEAARFVLNAAALRLRGHGAMAIETAAREEGGRFMRIAVVNEDMPFLVDSIATTVSAHGLVIDRLIHPVLPVERDGKGAIVALPDDEAPGIPRESVVYLETGRADARHRAQLSVALEQTLADVRACVADWPAMQGAMEEDAARLAAMERSEGAALVRWFKDGMMTQLGHVIRRRDGAQEGALGVCRQSTPELLSDASFSRAFAWFDGFLARGGAGRLPLMTKSNHIALVHRRVPLDVFIVPVIEDGRVAALSVHAGVWTSAALASPPAQVPLMRAQMAGLMEKFEFSAQGHAGKVLTHALTSLPHDQLIAFADADLERVALAMMSLIDRPRPRLALVAAPLDRHVFAFVWLPRDAVATGVRVEIAAMLSEAAGARVIDWSLEVEGSNLAQLRFILGVEDEGAALTMPDEAALDARLRAMLRGWGDAVEAEIAVHEEPSRAAAIAARYAEAFPVAYRNLYGPAEAAADIAHLRHLASEEARGVRLYRLSGDAQGHLRLKLYQRHGALVLSDVVPALENFGFRVIDTIPTPLEARGETLGSIHDFVLSLRAGQPLREVLNHAPIIEDALNAMLAGAGEDDGFNRLIVGLGLSAREANWLRALFRYLRQAGLGFGIDTAVDALINAPFVAMGLVDLFRARHQPGIEDRAAAQSLAEGAIRDGLGKVAGINDDRLLRAYRAVILAVLRTNAFVEGEALAFKFDSSAVPGLPKPLPWREVFVYSARVEGIHLRAGPVARGGRGVGPDEGAAGEECRDRADRGQGRVLSQAFARSGAGPRCLGGRGAGELQGLCADIVGDHGQYCRWGGGASRRHGGLGWAGPIFRGGRRQGDGDFFRYGQWFGGGAGLLAG
jgi:glutamate dehydrogenase